MSDEPIRVEVRGELVLWQSDIDLAEGDLTQAVQNVLGHSGFIVEEVEE